VLALADLDRHFFLIFAIPLVSVAGKQNSVLARIKLNELALDRFASNISIA
jgi:hypothetical protein